MVGLSVIVYYHKCHFRPNDAIIKFKFSLYGIALYVVKSLWVLGKKPPRVKSERKGGKIL